MTPLHRKSKESDYFQIVPPKKLPATGAWKATSLYVRLLSKGICFTCGAKLPMNKLVAGHFREKIGGSATYFDLDNLRCQCSWNCNRQKHGAKDIYAKKLIDEIGKRRFDDLFIKGQKAKQWTKGELEELADIREKMCEEILAKYKI